MKNRLLVVEDDRDLAQAMAAFFVHDSPELRVDFARSLEEARHELVATRYAVVVLDLVLPDGSGFLALDQIREGVGLTPSDAKVVVYSGVETAKVAPVAEQRGADAYYPKSEVGMLLLRGWVRVAMQGIVTEAREA